MQVKLHPDNFMFRHNEAQTIWLPNKMAFQTKWLPKQNGFPNNP